VQSDKVNNRKISDKQMYTLATIDYLVSGGDNFGEVMNRIPKSRMKFGTVGKVRELFMQYLKLGM
jgi:hypothetical protein